MGLSESLVAIRMRLLGGKQTATETKAVAKSVGEVGTAAEATTAKTAAAGGATSRFASKARSAWSTVTRVAKFAALAFAGALAGLALYAKKAIAVTEELAKTTSGLNKNLGLSVERASEFAAVASSRGLDNTKISMALKSLASQAVAASQGSGAAADMFKKMGFSQKDLHRSLGNTNFLLEHTADGLQNIPPGIERTTYASKLFGRGWKDLTPLIREGSDELNAQLDLAKEYGAFFTKDGVESVMAMVQAQREFKLANLGLQISLSQVLEPAVTDVIERITGMIKVLNDPKLTGEQKTKILTKEFENLVLKLQHIIERAAPVLASAAGHVGFAMIRALVAAFFSADLVGKLVIGSLIWKILGGKSVVTLASKGVGVLIGSTLGKGILAGILLVGIWTQLSDRSKDKILVAAGNMAVDFVNFFVKILNGKIDELNNVLNTSNPLGDLGPLSVGAPQIGHIGEQGHIEEERFHTPEGKGTAPGINWEEALGKPPPGSHKGSGKKGPKIKPRPNVGREPLKLGAAWRGGGTRTMQPIVLKVGGRTLAEITAEAREDEEARL